jgi:hypothetical protein
MSSICLQHSGFEAPEATMMMASQCVYTMESLPKPKELEVGTPFFTAHKNRFWMRFTKREKIKLNVSLNFPIKKSASSHFHKGILGRNKAYSIRIFHPSLVIKLQTEKVSQENTELMWLGAARSTVTCCICQGTYIVGTLRSASSSYHSCHHCSWVVFTVRDHLDTRRRW